MLAVLCLLGAADSASKSLGLLPKATYSSGKLAFQLLCLKSAKLSLARQRRRKKGLEKNSEILAL